MNSAYLAMEAQQVMWLRMVRVAQGGSGADSELKLMGTEKLMAAGELVTAAAVQAIGGKSSAAIANSTIRGYRTRVRANKRRLTK